MIVQEKLTKLRELMAAKGFEAYLINSSDSHQSEYTAPYFKAREYMSGFTGSAGTLLVTMDNAYLWTDGRYFIQAESQLKGSGIILMKQGEKGVPTIEDFLTDHIDDLMADHELIGLGFDPKTVSRKFYERLSERHSDFLGVHVGSDTDLVGEIWTDRPPLTFTPIFELDEVYTGKSRAEKLSELRAELDLGDDDIFVISALDETAWLLNIRASDVKYTPVALAYCIIKKNSADLFIDENAIDKELRWKLNADGVEIHSYNNFYDELEKLGSSAGRFFFDPDTTSYAVHACYGKGCKDRPALYEEITSPVIAMKAKKNDTECANIRKAHIIDGVAVTKLIYFLKTADEANIRSLDEIAVSDKLEEFRKQGENYLYQSFAPISAYGKNAAIVHYSADEQSNTKLDSKGFLLLDTGGQYRYGTTDITRTIALGELTFEQKQAYTAVLKGNLRLAAAKFKKGCSGVNLDILARQPLWELGWDYNHGTGHGVGYCLGVHEGPQGIRMRDKTPKAFEEGMLTSDEPGVYLENKFGIRLENLMLCVPCDDDFLRFEPVTMVPFDRSAIVEDDLTYEDIQLLNSYNFAVRKAVSPYLTEEERQWLEAETEEF